MENATDSLKGLDVLSGREFESLMAKLVRSLGFEIETQSAGADGGVDILAVSHSDLVSGRYVIQCKRQSQKVGVRPVRDLLGVVTHQRANKGILITNSSFTANAIQFAEGSQIELIDGSRLRGLMDTHLPGETPAAVESAALAPEGAAAFRVTKRRVQVILDLILRQQRGVDNNTISIAPKILSQPNAIDRFYETKMQELSTHMGTFANQLAMISSATRVGGSDINALNRVFDDIDESVKHMLKLQLAVHAAQTPWNSPQNRRLQHLKKVYRAFFTDLLELFEKLDSAASQELDADTNKGAIEIHTDFPHATGEVKRDGARWSGYVLPVSAIAAFFLMIGGSRRLAEGEIGSGMFFLLIAGALGVYVYRRVRLLFPMG